MRHPEWSRVFANHEMTTTTTIYGFTDRCRIYRRGVEEGGEVGWGREVCNRPGSLVLVQIARSMIATDWTRFF